MVKIALIINIRLSIKLVLIILTILTGDVTTAFSNNLIDLKNIQLSNQQIKNLREAIRKTIYVTKSRRDPETLPELIFYQYRVKKGDNFWKILSRTSQNIDTLMTINSLSCPKDIYPGKIIYIPNMRGIVTHNSNGKSLEEISGEYRIDKKYLSKINNLSKGMKTYLFIPNARVSNLERSLFIGTGFASPLKKGRRSSGFGKRFDPFNKKLTFHSGIDIACPVGSKVYASRSGQVTYTGFNGNYGLLVIIKHSHNYYSYYGHLSSIKVKKGSLVKRGKVIALSGNTGRSTGPHLHFEVRKKTRPVNPGILLRFK